MLYTILCYNSDEEVGSWTQEHDDQVMAKLMAVQDKLASKGQLGPVARLHGNSAARTLRKHREPHVVTDGPYAETKEHVLGFYVVDCATDEEAMEIARELGIANPGGAFEIRPISYFHPGVVSVDA